MKTTQHTPGKWHTQGGIVYAQKNPGGLKTQVAECFRDAGFDACRANARLIAAAPELLEACNRLLSRVISLTAHIESCDLSSSDELAIEQAHAAIAKAEGKE